jgi:hypothetical protein
MDTSCEKFSFGYMSILACFVLLSQVEAALARGIWVLTGCLE